MVSTPIAVEYSDEQAQLKRLATTGRDKGRPTTLAHIFVEPRGTSLDWWIRSPAILCKNKGCTAIAARQSEQETRAQGVKRDLVQA